MIPPRPASPQIWSSYRQVGETMFQPSFGIDSNRCGHRPAGADGIFDRTSAVSSTRTSHTSHSGRLPPRVGGGGSSAFLASSASSRNPSTTGMSGGISGSNPSGVIGGAGPSQQRGYSGSGTGSVVRKRLALEEAYAPAAAASSAGPTPRTRCARDIVIPVASSGLCTPRLAATSAICFVNHLCNSRM